MCIFVVASCSTAYTAPKFKRPPYAFPVNQGFSPATQAGPDLYEVRCGNNRLRVDVSDGFGQFYKQDGSLMSQKEFCTDAHRNRYRF